MYYVYCTSTSVYFPFSATLLVAINEIKKSARQNGLSFYEYGLYNGSLLSLIDVNVWKPFTPGITMNL